MFTPQEVTKKEFDKAVLGGYVMASVDEFMAQLGQDYAALYKENAILKNKLKVLVDKVEEYRSTEDAMRMALLSAKRTAREINEEAEEQKKQMLAEAEDFAELRRRELKVGIEAEEAALAAAKKNTSEYLEKIRAAAESYMRSLDDIYAFAEPAAAPSETDAASSLEKREEMITQTAKSIEDSVARILEQSISSADDTEDDNTKTYHPSSLSSAAEGNGGRIDMDNLKFGPNYVTE